MAIDKIERIPYQNLGCYSDVGVTELICWYEYGLIMDSIWICMPKCDKWYWKILPVEDINWVSFVGWVQLKYTGNSIGF